MDIQCHKGHRGPSGIEPAVVVVYELSEPDGRDAALQARKAWGRRYSHVEVLDLDHVAIFLMPGAARELRP